MSKSFKTLRVEVYILFVTKSQLFAMPSPTPTARKTVLLFHALSGACLASFVAIHLANQVLTAVNLERSLALTEILRTVYRWPPVEALLIACVFCQVASGPVLARSRAATASDTAGRVAAASGYYLLFFLVLHTAAVFWGRYGAGLDTNIYFAAAGLHAWPYAAFFSVYYFLAVVAVFVHVGLAIMRRVGPRAGRKRCWSVGIAVTGTVLAAVIVAGLSGLGNRMHIPDEYMSVYRR